MDMTATIQPKSDQLNADSLQSGPRTIRITSVTGNPDSAEQPVSVHYEGEDGRPFKPCKSMRRVMVGAWGPDAATYAGRSMTLFSDPKVQWGGMAVGGIRISHMSDIESVMTMALTATKGKRAPFVVKPLVVEKRAPDWTPYDALKEVADLTTEPDARTMWKRAMALSKADAESWKPVLEAITARVAVIKADADRATVDTVQE